MGTQRKGGAGGGLRRFPQLRLFDFSGGVSRNLGEYNLSRTLVTREIKTEFVYLVLGERFALLDFDYRGGNLAESCVGESYDGNVLYSVVLS